MFINVLYCLKVFEKSGCCVKKNCFEQLKLSQTELICYQLRPFVEGTRKLFESRFLLKTQSRRCFHGPPNTTFSLTRFSLRTLHGHSFSVYCSKAWPILNLFITYVTTIPHTNLPASRSLPAQRIIHLRIHFRVSGDQSEVCAHVIQTALTSLFNFWN